MSVSSVKQGLRKALRDGKVDVREARQLVAEAKRDGASLSEQRVLARALAREKSSFTPAARGEVERFVSEAPNGPAQAKQAAGALNAWLEKNAERLSEGGSDFDEGILRRVGWALGEGEKVRASSSGSGHVLSVPLYSSVGYQYYLDAGKWVMEDVLRTVPALKKYAGYEVEIRLIGG